MALLPPIGIFVTFAFLCGLTWGPMQPLLTTIVQIRIEPDAQGEPCLVRQAQDGRRALRLKGDAQTNLLTRALADDPHFGPYMAIPGKDNGFDVEGLAVGRPVGHQPAQPLDGIYLTLLQDLKETPPPPPGYPPPPPG